MGSRTAASAGKGKAAGRRPKLASREIDEKHIKQGMEPGEYIMGKRDTLPVQRRMRDGKGGVKASTLPGDRGRAGRECAHEGF